MPELIINIFLGFAGFLLALYITHKKRRKSEHFVCPLRGNCTEVIHSDFSKFFGIGVEYLGILYYSIIAVGYGVRAMWPGFDENLVVFLLFLSTFALTFSLYLTFIQIFTLRKLCTWCLISAFFTLMIFIFSVSSSLSIVIPFLSESHTLIFLLHIVAIALGLGAATLSDLFFFKFLRDFRISEMEAGILNVFSRVIWFSIGIIVMTGLGLFLPEIGTLLASSKFLMTWIIVGVIILNSAFLNLFIAPRFIQIQFGDHKHQPGELARTRRLAFAFGPISIVSWYNVFLLTMLEQAPASLDVMWRTYVALLIAAVVIGQIAERWIESQAHKIPPRAV
jgi:uncharacterized membrane protein